MKATRRVLKIGALPGVLALWVFFAGAPTAVHTQQPQIPTLQVSNQTKVVGGAEVKILSRGGAFEVKVNVTCPAGGYPTGTLQIKLVTMSDSKAAGSITATDIEQATSTGKDSPTAFISGRCKANDASGAAIPNCRFWIMLANNKAASGPGTPDVISFLVFDGQGKRIAYGTGPVSSRDITISPTSN